MRTRPGAPARRRVATSATRAISREGVPVRDHGGVRRHSGRRRDQRPGEAITDGGGTAASDCGEGPDHAPARPSLAACAQKAGDAARQQPPGAQLRARHPPTQRSAARLPVGDNVSRDRLRVVNGHHFLDADGKRTEPVR